MSVEPFNRLVKLAARAFYDDITTKGDNQPKTGRSDNRGIAVVVLDALTRLWFVMTFVFFYPRRQWVREEDLAKDLKLHSKQLRRTLRFFEEEKLVTRDHRREVNTFVVNVIHSWGDFNITLFQRERSRQGRITSTMWRFAQIIDELGLVDLPLQGEVFTWSGGLNNQSWARLDRFLVPPSWLDHFSGVLQSRLPRPISDHFPVLLEGGGLRRGPSPFRFENMWLKVEGFIDLIRSWWRGIEVRGTVSFRLAAKMKGIKQKLKVWNREVFGSLECNKASALQQEVREGVVNAYQQMLSEDSGWKADIGRLQLEQINQQEAENLEIPFFETEVHSALMEMNGDKAPGPDGFTMVFWQSCWDFVQEEILQMFKEFHEHISFLKSLNNTFLVLISKKGGAKDLGDFRPISLLGGLYKLLAKLLANRLKRVLAKFSVLINGVLVGFFSSTKGFRQRDPLSPYLFVLGMEVLDALIRRAVAGGFLSGCSIRGGRRPTLNISHLFFADDIVVFCEANKEHLTHLSWILFWFEAASSLRINLAKSEIIPVGVVEEIDELATELGCRVGSLPSQYLGLPLGAPNKAHSVWDGVEERMRGRLALWKRQYISKSGRITLIKSILTSMPIYQMSLFRMPKTVARRLEKVQRDFLWGEGNLERKAHLVNWEVVCADKNKGGLGLRKLALLNKALLGKWIWRFAFDKDNLWKQVIMAKYGQERSWLEDKRRLMGRLEGNFEGN
uniref:HTH TFE/IIEalpha-type domain-containing protein n=1 Tax=Vitis vinifera TaxID=29760 RepID=A5CAZ7_VITVI|nr:hypothetical protein VITISV_044337 [Vitis vinifera]